MTSSFATRSPPACSPPKPAIASCCSRSSKSHAPSSRRARRPSSCSTRATDELVFEAVAGEGASSLIGQRLPSSTGIAGWVLVTGQPLVLDDLEADPRFARDVAESTGYVPKSLMAVPLLHGEEVLGVLQVLDRPQRERFSLQEMELLGLFGNQAAIALDLLGRARRARSVVDDESPLGVVARIAAELDALPAARRDAGLALLAALERVIAR